MTVLVLGMHRSGTSAATRIASLLGVPTCRAEDLSDDRAGNERGLWESASLVQENDALLAAAGAAWWCPPPAGEDWSAMAIDRGESARAAFRRAHPGPTWIWKDPRLCLTAEFWMSALAIRPPVLLVLRDPLEIAASLTARNHFSTNAGLGLWERYLREALRQIVGLPVFVTRFDELIADPVAWCADVGSFLLDSGVLVDPARAQRAAAYLDPELQHHRPGVAVAAVAPSREQQSLSEGLAQLAGPHPRFGGLDAGPETPSTERFLAEQRATRRRGASARWAEPELHGAPCSEVPMFAPAQPVSARGSASLSVVVICRDEAGWVGPTVERLSATAPGAEIVVVDDCSTDGGTDDLDQRAGVRVWRSERPLGIARARNAGARVACGDVLVFSDAHVNPAPGWYQAMEPLLRDGRTGAVGPSLGRFRDTRDPVHGLTFDDAALNVRWLRLSQAHPVEVPLLPGCFLGIRRVVFDAVGGFDEAMTGYGSEDLDLCLRLWRAGYQCMMAPAAVVGHRFDRGERPSVDRLGFLHNLLRLASVHLAAPRLERVVTALRHDPRFAEAMALVLAGGVGERRAEVEARSWHDDEFFFRRFGPAVLA